MVLPDDTAASIPAKSSFISTSEDAERASSLPRLPIEIPMCAALSAGPSFTPSPVMATMSPEVLSSCMTLNLFSGITRANTETVFSFRLSSSSVSLSIAFPVSTSSLLCKPIFLPIAAAVSG
ncbi:MAG: hypothetical protein BWY67_02122 [Bacteroidetes bacterium ADurb.Bin397]|nr:MAG: hypothetical protein BWY67_02122 [Bacteroidetes bacterium ADurb.Bin397]